MPRMTEQELAEIRGMYPDVYRGKLLAELDAVPARSRGPRSALRPAAGFPERHSLSQRGGGEAHMRLLLLLLCCCSSRPELYVPPADAGADCRACWSECERATSRKQVTFCAAECNRICEEGQR